jgi:hypothetical protein
LQVIDISDPVHCVRAGSFETGGEAMAVAVSGKYAFVAAGSAGLVVIDISDPAHCVRAGGLESLWSKEVAVQGNFACVAGGSGLHVIDISDPAHCLITGTYDSTDINSVTMSGPYAFIADYDGSYGMEIIDLSNPAHPVRTGALDEPTYATGVGVSAHFAFLLDRDGLLYVVDVSDLANPVCAGVYDATGGAGEGYPHVMAVDGDRIYVANQKAGLVILPSLPGLQLSIRVNATPGESFTLETSTSLEDPASWAPLWTGTASATPFDFVDFDVKLSEKPKKFYRVRQP